MPTSATHSPRLISNEIRSTATDDAAGLVKRHRQIADIEQGLVDGVHAGLYLNVLRGSNASRTASPMKISSDSMMATAKNPQKPSHGA